MNQRTTMNTTLGMHVHLTLGWEILHDDPGERFSLLRPPGGQFATVHHDGSDWVLSILTGSDWETFHVVSTDGVARVLRDIS